MKKNFNIIQNFDAIKKQVENQKILNRKKLVSASIEKILNNNSKEKNLDLVREIMLAKELGLDSKKIQKLIEDYKKTLTVADVLNHGEIYWSYNKIKIAVKKLV